MKRSVLLYFILLYFVFINKAQNLVPNPSFEEKYDCTYAVLYNAKEWCSVGTNCGYYYACQINPSYAAPFININSCMQSFQIPRSGDAYAELYGYKTTETSTPNRYAQVKLIDTLTIGKIYCVAFYLNLFNYSQYTTDKIGAVLTPTPFPCLPPATAPNYTLTGVTPSIYSTPGVQLSDTLNWMEVSGTYTANGTEAYIAIGDFFLQSQHSIVQSYPANCNGIAEYYLDDVSVEEVFPAKAKNDTTIMFGDSTVLGNNLSDAAIYSWQPTLGLSCPTCANPNASPNVTTSYTLTKTQCKAVTTATITVNVDNVGVNELNIDTVTQLSPNPTNGVLNVSSRFDISNIEVLTVTGQLLFSEKVDAKEHQLKLNGLAEGIYFVRIIYPNGLSVIKKIIVNQ